MLSDFLSTFSLLSLSEEVEVEPELLLVNDMLVPRNMLVVRSDLYMGPGVETIKPVFKLMLLCLFFIGSTLVESS